MKLCRCVMGASAAIVLSSLPTVSRALPYRAGSAVDAQSFLRRAISVMDRVRTVHGEGTVVMRYYKQSIRLQITGDCDASQAKHRSGNSPPVQARTWVRGRYTNHGKAATFDAHFVLISAGPQSLVWERSAQTGNRWMKRPVNRAIASYAPDLCSVLLMAPVPASSNVKHYYRDLGLRTVAGRTVRLIRVTATKPGDAFQYDWYIDPASFRVLRSRTVVANAPPAPPNTSQSVTVTYSGFDAKVTISSPR